MEKTTREHAFASAGRRGRQVLAILMTLAMLVGLMPTIITPASAAYEDGEECWNCGHYHWDEYMHECGACSPDCTNDWCALETHCHNCGECLNGEQPCENCGLCENCAKEMGHCTTCGECWMDNEPDKTLCGDCGQCYFCSPICEECGLCAECANDWDDGMHCPECRSCYQVTEQCEFLENNHCKDCCRPCDQCGECIAGDALTYCYDCGLCVECCEFNSMMAGCEDGDVCVASSEWDDHICYDCSQFFGSLSEMCETCVASGYARCEECCEASSQCSEGMCEYAEEYEEHFCMDCGNCFHEEEQCLTCADAGEFRCKDCCAAIANSYGCDCGDKCFNDPGFEEHLDALESEGGHGGLPDSYTHDATASMTWSFDDKEHWHDCRYCDEDSPFEEVRELAEEHHEALYKTTKNAHDFDEAGMCTVCGYVKSGNVIIQNNTARTITAKVSDENAGKDDPYHISNNTITLKADVRYNKKSGQELVYNWYVHYQYIDALGDEYEETLLAEDFCNGKYDKSDQKHSPYDLYGAERENGAVWQEFYEPTWTFSVPYTACVVDYSFFCEIEVYEKDAAWDAKPIKTIRTQPITLKAQHLYSFASSSYQIKAEDREKGHLWLCAGCSFNDDIVYSKNWAKRSSALESHRYGPFQLVTKNGETYRKAKCLDCGYTGMTKTHIHAYYDDVNFEYKIDEEHTDHYNHALRCVKEGCDQIKLERHDWEWKIVGYPKASDPTGYLARECRICGYREDNIYVTENKGGKPTLVAKEWNLQNVLVQSRQATASKDLVVNGDELTLTVLHRDGEYERCTGWTVKYYTWADGTKDLTSQYTFTQDTTDPNVYTCTVTYPGNSGGVLYLTPTMEKCTDHSRTHLANQKDAVCTQNGYTGDTVCDYCGYIVKNGVETSGGTAHTGTLEKLYRDANGQATTTVTATRYNAKTGSCTVRGYEGDYRCTACKSIVKGENTGFRHGPTKLVDEVKATCTTQGYTGDKVCQSCGKLVKRGTTVAAAHTTGARVDLKDPTTYPDYQAPTCTATGKTGTVECTVCGETIRANTSIAALGHDWKKDSSDKIEWVIVSPTAEKDGSRTRTCKTCGYKDVQKLTAAEGNTITTVTLTTALPKVGVSAAEPPYNDGAKLKESTCYLEGSQWRLTAREDDDGSMGFWRNSKYTFEAWVTAAGDKKFTKDTVFTVNGVKVNGLVWDKGEKKEIPEEGTKEAFVRWDYPETLGDGPVELFAMVHSNSSDPNDRKTNYVIVDENAEAGETVTVQAVTDGSKFCFSSWFDESEGRTFNSYWMDPSGTVHEFGKTDFKDAPVTTVTIPKEATYVQFWANLAQKPAGENVRTLSLQATVGGTASASAYYAEKGGTITLTATPDAGYRFSGWKVLEGDAAISGDTLTMGEKDTTVKAIFAKTDHTHSFTRENPTAKDLKSAATCTAPAVYYKSCLCGEHGDATFTYGEALGHTSVNRTCTRCGATTGGSGGSGGTVVTPPDPGPGTDPTPGTGFVDVKPGSYYEEPVDWAVEKGITTGTSSTTFDPNGICTRAQAVTFLWRAAGSPTATTTELPFTDVPAGSYYEQAVLWAVETGVTKGTSETTFSPNADCTRAQIVTFLWRAQGTPAATAADPFTDLKPGAYYIDAVLWAVEKGITTGTTATTFSPNADCTRAQIVTFLYRCLG